MGRKVQVNMTDGELIGDETFVVVDTETMVYETFSQW